MRKVAGSLDFVSSIINLYFWMRFIDIWGNVGEMYKSFEYLPNFFLFIGLIIVAGVTALGGVLAFRAKRWKLALIGSIFTIIMPSYYQWYAYITYPVWLYQLNLIALLIGITAIVLTILSRKDFFHKQSDKAADNLKLKELN